MLNRRVKFRPFHEDLPVEQPAASKELLQLVNPTKRMLKELPGMLKRSPNLEEVIILADDLNKTWMIFCSSYLFLKARSSTQKCFANTTSNRSETNVMLAT